PDRLWRYRAGSANKAFSRFRGSQGLCEPSRSLIAERASACPAPQLSSWSPVARLAVASAFLLVRCPRRGGRVWRGRERGFSVLIACPVGACKLFERVFTP